MTSDTLAAAISQQAEEGVLLIYEQRMATAITADEMAMAGFARDIAMAGITAIREAQIDHMTPEETGKFGEDMAIHMIERLASLIVGLGGAHELAVNNLLDETIAGLRRAAENHMASRRQGEKTLQ